MFYPYEGYRSVTPLDAARVFRKITEGTISETLTSSITIFGRKQWKVWKLKKKNELLLFLVVGNLGLTMDPRSMYSPTSSARHVLIMRELTK